MTIEMKGNQWNLKNNEKHYNTKHKIIDSGNDLVKYVFSQTTDFSTFLKVLRFLSPSTMSTASIEVESDTLVCGWTKGDGK